MSEHEDSDMTLRIAMLRSQRERKNLGKWSRIAQIAQEYRRMLKVKEDNHPVDPEEVGSLIASAYPERIAMAVDNIGNFRMSGGQNIFIDRNDPMSLHSWLAIASLNSAGSKGKVFLSAPISINDLCPHLRSPISRGTARQEQCVCKVKDESGSSS